MSKSRLSYWWARIPIFIVFFFNIQCAFAFLISPNQYTPSFELIGDTGRWMIQAMGILFIMWNIPYLFALLNPVHNFTSLKEAVLMQFVGGLGESVLYLTINNTHGIISESIHRFMLFDWCGLVLLIAALLITYRIRKGVSRTTISS